LHSSRQVFNSQQLLCKTLSWYGWESDSKLDGDIGFSLGQHPESQG